MAQTTKKYQIIQKVSASDTVLLHPETESSVVTYDNTTSQLTATNVKAAVDELKTKVDTVQLNVDSLAQNVVTGVKGSAENNYRSGNVSISYSNVGAEQAGAVSTHNSSGSAHSDIRASITTAQNTANEAKSIAEGRVRAFVFDTVTIMATTLAAADKTTYKIGDNLFNKQTDVPDYWVSAVNDVKSGDFGYYEVSPLEGRHVDIDQYQKKYDGNLSTISKYVVAAINEVKSLADVASDEATSARTTANTTSSTLTDVLDGVRKVGKATTADTATSATSATSAGKWTSAITLGVSISGGYKSDGSTLISATGTASVDGHENKTVAVTMADSGVAAGTYSAVQVNAKGIAVAGGQMIEIGTTGQTTPSASLANGGIFFKEV